MKRVVQAVAVVGMLGCLMGCAGADEDPVSFSIRLAECVAPVSDGARVYVLMVPGEDREPLFARPHEQIVLACDGGARSGEGLWEFDSSSEFYPAKLSSLEQGSYTVRAVVDRNVIDWRTAWAEGNSYSSKQTVRIDPAQLITTELLVEHTVEREAFVPTDRIREVRLKSDRVSAFLGDARYLKAAVVLPEGYEDSRDLYPSVYVLPGWGASHTALLHGDHQQRRYGMEGFGREKVFIFLDHEMVYGAHCFANSETVGPWGDALVEELIPRIESEFRVIPDGRARFLAGQSSGGWGSLWLQLSFPNSFAGAFACSPDFLDFRAFGDGLNLYDPEANYHRHPDGRFRAGVRSHDSGEVVMTSSEADRRSQVVRGADQLSSFEAVFGSPDGDGRPVPLVDRSTGEIDRSVLGKWAAYDLSRMVGNQWPEIGPQIDGKIHVWVGDEDDYFLDEAVRLFGERLDDVGADAFVEVIPGLGHDVWSDRVRGMMHDEMARILEEAGY